MAAGARMQARAPALAVPQKFNADAVLARGPGRQHFKTTDRIVALGASTGGTEAIREILEMLPADAPGLVITQHIPEAFSRPFAERMDRCSALKVKEAADGDLIKPGHAYIAPGIRHLLVVRDGARYRCRLNDGPPVIRHRPSVDVLFRSVAQQVGPNALAVLLTGMGDDGARGMAEMHETGALTICQDEKTSVVWGMPGSAVRLGCVDSVVPLAQIAALCLAGNPQAKQYEMAAELDYSESSLQHGKESCQLTVSGRMEWRRSPPTAARPAYGWPKVNWRKPVAPWASASRGWSAWCTAALRHR